MAAKPKVLKPNFYEIETYQSTWDLPERYQELYPLGAGAFGTVW